MRVAIAQIASTEDKLENISEIRKNIKIAGDGCAKIVCFPESSLYRGGKEGKLRSGEYLDGPSVVEIMEEAKTSEVYVLFSFLEKTDNCFKIFNTTLLVNPCGDICGIYRKIHLFDVTLSDGTSTLESECILPGKELGLTDVCGCSVGIMTCYDLRFPELARRLTLEGVKIIFLPADFTAETGKAHWEVLLRARAIENQVFIVAPNQMGRNSVTGIESYGRSMVVDPWGVVISVTPDEGGVFFAELDFEGQENIRNKFPVLEHLREF